MEEGEIRESVRVPPAERAMASSRTVSRLLQMLISFSASCARWKACLVNCSCWLSVGETGDRVVNDSRKILCIQHDRVVNDSRKILCIQHDRVVRKILCIQHDRVVNDSRKILCIKPFLD